MRIAVIGAGAVGGVLAALLDRASHEVEVVARGAHLDAIGESGIFLDGVLGSHRARVRAVPALNGPPELAVVAVKAADADTALRAAAGALTGVPVVVVQNGLGALSSGRAGLPHSPVVGGLALFAASHLVPGRVTVTGPGGLHLGVDPADRGAGRALVLAARVLRDALPVVRVRDFAGAQWSKLVVNQVNALPAVTGLSVQETVEHPGLRRLLVRGMRETVRAGLAAGVHFAPLASLTHARLRAFALAPDAVAGLLPLAMARRMGPVPNPGSTLQSIRRGRPTEIDALSGAVVEAARAAGVAAPVTAMLVRLVHEVEAGGGFVPVDEVLRRSGRAVGGAR